MASTAKSAISKGASGATNASPGAASSAMGALAGLSSAAVSNASMAAATLQSQVAEKRGDASAAKDIAQTNLNRVRTFKEWVSGLTAPFRKALGVMFDGRNPIAHYVALVLFVLILAGALTALVSSFRSYFRVKVNPYSTFNKFFQKLLPGYRSRLAAKSITPYSGNIPSTPRQKIVGRCDNLTMRERITDKTGGGLCETTTAPEKLQWVMDPEAQPDFEKLPSLLKSKLTGDQGEKYVVHIPWKVYSMDGTNYYPDCSQAKFSDGTDASYLFTDNGIASCTRKRTPRSEYVDKYRPIQVGGNKFYQGLDAYADEKNPRCK